MCTKSCEMCNYGVEIAAILPNCSEMFANRIAFCSRAGIEKKIQKEYNPLSDNGFSENNVTTGCD